MSGSEILHLVILLVNTCVSSINIDLLVINSLKWKYKTLSFVKMKKNS